jgi:DNA mismatch repair protein MutS2
VLIDEMGTGTDPTEGAALARAILEELTARGARSIVTSHLGALKTLDAPGSGVVNASLQFDADRMEPTYHFVKGRPGRSYGLAIARKLGFPAELLDRSQELVDEGSASLEDLLERLEARERSVEDLQERLARATDEVERLGRDLAERERRLELSERDLERKARDDARRLLLEARGEVEEAIREVRAAGGRDADAAARGARRRVEEAAREQLSSKPSPRRSGAAVTGLDVGARVRLPGAGSRGTVLELREGRASVDVGGLRVELRADELELVEDGGEEPVRRAPQARWQAALPAGGPEIDLRGLRVDEVELELGRALDAALLSDLSEVRVIHGMGTGAVRARVHEVLAADPRVGEHRLGVHGEGGAGVTLAWFR